MNTISCVGLIPAEREMNRAQGLNVLVMAINHSDTEQTATVRIFGAEYGEPKPLTGKSCTLAPNDHAHLYFHIPPACFAAEFWEGRAPEEITVCAGTAYPETPGELVFINN